MATLLESADTRSETASNAPSALVSVSSDLQDIAPQQRRIRSRLVHVTELREPTEVLETGNLPEDWERWTDQDRQAWLDQRIARWTRSPSPTDSTAFLPPSSTSRQRSSHRRPPRYALPQPSPQERETGLPTPPHDPFNHSESLIAPGPGDLMRRSHPLRRSWRAESPIDGLGDRIRSPTPADGWETMQTTIAPDENLPSAESSFASAAASDSFNSRGTNSNDAEGLSTSESSRRTSDEGENPSDSASSIDPDDLCNDEERQATASFATDMYLFECGYHEGHERVEQHRAAVAAEGNRYALFDESESVEIGFRLINAALDTPEGRARVFQLSQARPGPTPEHRNFEEWIFAHRRNNDRRTRLAHITDDQPPSPRPERYGRDARTAAHEARGQVHDYFRRITADALTGTDATDPGSGLDSPPPRYERLASRIDEDEPVSQDRPGVHTASTTGRSNRRRVVDAWFSGEEPDLDGVRRIVERLAQREDIPDEWWTSVGLARHLNQSRSRVRSRSPDRRNLSADGTRVRAGRIDRSSQSPRL